MSNEIIREDMEYADLEKLLCLDSYDGALCDIALTKNECIKHATKLKVNESIDNDYKRFLSGLLSWMPRSKFLGNVAPSDYFDVHGDGSDAREGDEDTRADEEGDKDPNYEHFLKHLLANGNSYMCKSQSCCSPLVIKYEVEESLYEEHESYDSYCKRKWRSSKQQNHQAPSKCGRNLRKPGSSEDGKKPRRKQLSEAKMIENMENSNEDVVIDPEYDAYIRVFKLMAGCEYGADTMLRKMEGGKVSSDRDDVVDDVVDDDVVDNDDDDDDDDDDVVVVDDDDDDEVDDDDDEEDVDDDYDYDYDYDYDDGVDDDDDDNDDDGDDDDDEEVEILDSVTYKMGGSSSNSMEGANNNSAFRRQLMDVLRKPYDGKEYEKLRFDVEVCKAVNRHMDLRHGRERSHSTSKYGKSYLDHYPALRKRLLRFEGDKPRCLNLLRGFFFWLEKSSHDKSFQPWHDAECLAISPDSG